METGIRGLLPILPAVLLAILMGLGLNACAFGSRQKVRALQAECRARLADHRIDPIRGKVALQMDQIEPSMLILPAAPDATEKAALQAFAMIRQECNKDYLAAAESIDPQNAYRLRATLARYEMVYAKLYDGEISFGNANQLLEQAAIEATGDYDQSVLEDLRDAQARRDAAALRAGATSIRPTYADCAWVEGSMRCTR